MSLARYDAKQGGPPRVLQVVLSLNPGGTERLVIDLAKRLHEEAPTAVCCLDVVGSWATELTSMGVVVSALGREPGFHPGLSRHLAQAAARHRATVIHAHHYSPFVYSALARIWQPSLRVIFTEHGRLSDSAPSTKRRVVNQFLGRAATGVFAVSEDVKRHLIGEGISAGRVGVIYNGIEVGRASSPALRAEIRQRLDVPEDAFVIGTIARLDPVKDLGTLLKTMVILGRDSNTCLMIIGDGTERAALEAQADQLGVSRRIRFLGHRNDARDWLAGCDAYVNCSISEGVSLTILEAMAAMLPIVATGVGGTPEVVDETCGRLVPSRDPSALSAALLELASRPSLRQELGEAARRRVEAQFTLVRMVSAYHDIYRGKEAASA